MRSAADCHIFNRSDRLFFRINNLQFFHTTLLQLSAHNLRQRAHLRLIDICHPKCTGIQLISGTHTADNRSPCLLCTHDQFNLRSHCVHSIYHIIILTKIEISSILRKIKTVMDSHICFRINVQDPVPHHLCFILTNSFPGGNNLSVKIRQAYFVIINQIKGPHTASDQCFTYISSNPSDSKHCHAGVLQFIHCFFSQKKLCS